ncbi:MAG: HD domain-containing protein [Elusimicrobia bacterium]|nr:HD domain-containing protein [Elusimicrobiota bacterium]
MKFDMSRCLDALSLALDFAGTDTFDPKPNHSRRTAYVALAVADELGIPEEDKKDLYALALLHDNGIVMSGQDFNSLEQAASHCIHGEKNLAGLPLQKPRRNVIRFHHENYDGSGPFRVRGADIPLLARLIHLANTLEAEFDLWKLDPSERKRVREYALSGAGKRFDPDAAAAFQAAARKERFWCDMTFGNDMDSLHRRTPQIFYDFQWKDIVSISEIFMRIVDSKSRFTFNHSGGLAAHADTMSDFYGFTPDTKIQLHIAAHLHDLGKLYVPNAILEKPGSLDAAELACIKRHPYITKLVLEKIPFFEEIAAWAGNHHERLNGKGYPDNLTEKELDCQSRLLGVLDIYQAMTEERPYRKAVTHKEAVETLNGMVRLGYLDAKMVKDVSQTVWPLDGNIKLCDPCGD